MEAQFNIRHNTMELQEYLKDLNTWEASVKKKDKDLKMGRMPGSSNSVSASDGATGVPAPRGRAGGGTVEAAPSHLQAPASQLQNPKGRATAQKARKKKRRSNPKPSTAAGHTYQHYRDKWENFDVDAALAEVESEESTSEEEEARIEAANDELPPVRAPLDSEGWRSKGNEWFKTGDYLQAKECYSASIDQEPNSLAYANRAMASLKLGETRLAEEDCTAAIALDPLYLKSWQRRGAARQEQGRLEEATADLEMALRLQPTSTALRKEFQACYDALQSRQRLRPLCRSSPVPVRIVKGPHKDVISSATSDAEPQAASAGIREVPSGPAANASPAPDGATVDTKQERQKIRDSNVRVSVAAAAARAVELISKDSAAAHAVPKTSTDFEIAWKSLCTNPEGRIEYLRQIDPRAFPVLFKTSLTGPLLGSIVATALQGVLLNNGNTEWAVATLQGLAAVPRFEMTAMLLPRADKTNLRNTLDGCLSVLDGNLRNQLEAVKKQLKL